MNTTLDKINRYSDLRQYNEHAALLKKQACIEENKKDKIWEKQFIKNIYQEKPGTILDFFYQDKDRRGYNCGIMRQRKTDIMSDMRNKWFEYNLFNSI